MVVSMNFCACSWWLYNRLLFYQCCHCCFSLITLFLFLFFPFQEGISLAWSPCVALVILTLAVFLMCPWPFGHWRWALRWSSTFAVLWFVALASRALAFVGFTGGVFVTGTLAVHWNWWIVCSMFLSFFLLGPVERWSHLRVIFFSFSCSRNIFFFFFKTIYHVHLQCFVPLDIGSALVRCISQTDINSELVLLQCIWSLGRSDAFGTCRDFSLRRL